MRASFWFGLLITFCMLSLYPLATTSAAGAPQGGRPTINPPTTSYENVTLTEDVSWRGSVVVKGALVIAPQATLRIEPGTQIRFQPSKSGRHLPRLVILGRIQAVGTSDQPIIFSPSAATPVKKGTWGGIVLLSSEKRNQLEQCRIEGAESALEGRHSLISLKSVSIVSSLRGVVLQDCTAVVTQGSVSDCETGIEAHDSELELRDTTLSKNRRGAALLRSSVVMSSVTVSGNSQQGLLAEECRLKLTSTEVSGNAVGAQIKGGEGQLFMCRFKRNTDTALQLASARLKINRCQISDNQRDGIRLEDGRATLWGNSFGGNGGHNLVNAGTEPVSALQNWWGSDDEAALKGKIVDLTPDGQGGLVHVFPWLHEKPALLP